MRAVIVPILFFFFGLTYFGATHAAAQITLNPVPTRVIGQDSVQIVNLNPNLVEGREFEYPTAIALDTSVSPPALYVSDTGNNRVLGFHNAASFSNGQPADIAIGQPDLKTTLPAGPGTSRTTGLSGPTGIAVDRQGNLYVVDTDNNRILRFPKPFSQPGGAPLPDIVIGQPTFATGAANQGGISAATLSFTLATSATTTTPVEAFITFDSAGNLWVADSANNRVLRFNASVLGSQASSGPAADIVLGQVNFISNTFSPPAGSNPLLSTSSFTTPAGIAFDAAGRLFVCESTSTQRGRVLMWTPPFSPGVGPPANRLLGVDTNNPQPPLISEFQLGASPGAVFPIPAAGGLTSIGVVDTMNNRVLVFPPVEQWTAGTYQAAVAVAGQSDFSSGMPFAGQITAGPSGLFRPNAALFYGNELYIADTFDHRVIPMPQNGSSFGPATQVLGQDLLTLNAPNLVEGREFNLSSGDSGLAVDLSSNPPHLYVADPGNNRILGFYDSRNINGGVKADIVIGQPDFQQTQVNYPSNNGNTPNSSGLFNPIGLIVDPAGNLYVADTGNSRVLRFPAPFANYVPGTPPGTPPPAIAQANLVLGQINFTSVITDATQRTMAQPYGLALTNYPGLLVSDAALNRVLYFAGTSPDLSNFTSGMPASMVFGQPDFISSLAGSGSGQLNAPRHISVDSDDRLYVADSGNRRIAIWNHAPTAVLAQPAAQFLTSGLSSPHGIFVNDVNGDIWVADASGLAIRYPAFNALEAGGYMPNEELGDLGSPRAVAEDAWGNLFLADLVNRVLIYYPGLGAINAASFLGTDVLAPGMIAALFSQGNAGQFGGQSTSASALPLPKQLNGVQVLFNGSPVPLFYAGPDQINFVVPMAAPQTGTADLQVVQTAGGRVLGDTTVEMVAADPGIFSLTGNGIGTAAAVNQDGTINGPTNPAIAGQTIQIFGTGQGFVAGAPPDGTAPTGPLQSSIAPTVIIGPDIITGTGIAYSGLAPGEVGVWQLNVVIPNDIITLPTNPTYVVIIQNSIASGSPSVNRAVQIYVKHSS
jgi:uncharacterized protein (TIGR03437 family)